MNCDQCNIKALSEEGLNKHVAESHIFKELFSFIEKETDDNKINLKQNIDKITSIKSVLTDHIKRENGSIPTKKNTLNNQKLNKSSESKSFKIKCESIDSIKIENGKEQKEKMNVKIKCEIDNCNYSTYQKQKLKYHTDAIHYKITRFSCNICEYKSYFKHCVASHQKNNHKNEKINILRERNINHEHQRKKRQKHLRSKDEFLDFLVIFVNTNTNVQI